MALETAIYPQDKLGIWGYDYLLQEDKCFYGLLELESNNIICQNNAISSGHANNNLDYYCSPSSVMHNDHNSGGYDVKDHWGTTAISSPEVCTGGELAVAAAMTTTSSKVAAAVGRKKRRRTKSGKNKQELESQRMTHITVERNRRKQMNEYLAVIRSMMPSSYVQRGDQASIIGGAINFVKELEQQLQTLEVQQTAIKNGHSSPPTLPFSEFFTFPQYSTRPPPNEGRGSSSVTLVGDNSRPPAMAEIEVTMVENHASLKILSKKRSRQLLKMVCGLQCLWLTILHLNVTTVDQMVLYSLSVKMEDGCQLNTVDDIADAVNCMLGRIEDELTP